MQPVHICIANTISPGLIYCIVWPFTKSLFENGECLKKHRKTNLEFPLLLLLFLSLSIHRTRGRTKTRYFVSTKNMSTRITPFWIELLQNCNEQTQINKNKLFSKGKQDY